MRGHHQRFLAAPVMLALLCMTGFGLFVQAVGTAGQNQANAATGKRAKLKIAVFTGGADADLATLRETLKKLPVVKSNGDELKFGDFRRDGGLFVEPFFIEITDTDKTDIGDVAKAVASAKLTKNDGGLYLFMRYLPASINTKELRAALAPVKGVQSDKSWAGDNNIWVHVDGSGQAKLREITRAMHGAGAKFRDPLTDIGEP